MIKKYDILVSFEILIMQKKEELKEMKGIDIPNESNRNNFI